MSDAGKAIQEFGKALQGCGCAIISLFFWGFIAFLILACAGILG